LHLTASIVQREVLSTEISEFQKTTLNETAVCLNIAYVKLASTPSLEIAASPDLQSHEHQETPTLLEKPSTSTKKVGPYEIAPLPPPKAPHQSRRKSAKLGKAAVVTDSPFNNALGALIKSTMLTKMVMHASKINDAKKQHQ